MRSGLAAAVMVAVAVGVVSGGAQAQMRGRAQVLMTTRVIESTADAASGKIKVKVLTSPKLATISGRQARVVVGSDESSVTVDLKPTVAPSGLVSLRASLLSSRRVGTGERRVRGASSVVRMAQGTPTLVVGIIDKPTPPVPPADGAAPPAPGAPAAPSAPGADPAQGSDGAPEKELPLDPSARPGIYLEVTVTISAWSGRGR